MRVISPKPKDGLRKFYQNHIYNKLKYPTEARKLKAEGKVVVEFVVNKDGRLTNRKVVREIGNGCEQEAMRLLVISK